MLAWMPMSAAKSNPETQDRPVPASLLYRFSIAFSNWGGRDYGRVFYFVARIWPL
jgi:hypothetical protein